jgi:hypothetical protein
MAQSDTPRSLSDLEMTAYCDSPYKYQCPEGKFLQRMRIPDEIGRFDNIRKADEVCGNNIYRCRSLPMSNNEISIFKMPQLNTTLETTANTAKTTFETARTNMFNQLIIYIQVLASNSISPVADSQTTLETNIATNLNDIVNNEIIIAKFPSTSTTNTSPAYDTAVLTYTSSHKIYIKKLISNIATSQPAQQPAQQPAPPRAQPAPQYTPPPAPPAEQDTASKADTKSDNKMYVIIAIIITIIVIGLVVYFMMNKSDSGSVSSMKPIMTKKGGYYYFL